MTGSRTGVNSLTANVSDGSADDQMRLMCTSIVCFWRNRFIAARHFASDRVWTLILNSTKPSLMPHSPIPDQIEALTSWITTLRPARNSVDPFRPHGFFLEQERTATGEIASSAVILLTNKECPWRCLMCDLWKNTTTQTVPLGAIPEQIRYALSRLEGRPKQIKLYNSGSFFDPAAIPTDDHPAIARAVSLAGHVVVESHPRLVGEKATRFRDLLAGSLEVALGLETVHPKVLPRLNKKFTLGHFAGAVEFLRENNDSHASIRPREASVHGRNRSVGMGGEVR